MEGSTRVIRALVARITSSPEAKEERTASLANRFRQNINRDEADPCDEHEKSTQNNVWGRLRPKVGRTHRL